MTRLKDFLSRTNKNSILFALATFIILSVAVTSTVSFIDDSRNFNSANKSPTTISIPSTEVAENNFLSDTLANDGFENSSDSSIKSIQEISILECDKGNLFDADDTNSEIYKNAFLAEADKFSNQSNSQSSTNYEVMATLFSTSIDNDLRIDQLAELSKQYPNNELLAKSMLSSCLSVPQNSNCGNTLAERAIELDGDNAFVWSTKAALEFGRGDVLSAKESLLVASTKERYQDMIPDFMQQQQIQSNDATGGLLFYQTMAQMQLAIKLLGADGGAGLISIQNLCRNESKTDEDLYNACISYSRLAHEFSGTLMGSRLASVIELETRATVDDQPEYVAAVQREFENRNSYIGDHRKAIDLASHDERLHRKYTGDLIQYGENRAIQNLVLEARLLSADPNYNPCK